jgi:hypothetical protein
MDADIVEDMAMLYQYLDKIPSPQFYQLLIALVPKSNRYYPWVKSKKMKHKKELLEYVAKRFQVSIFQANEYVNILLRTEEGQSELVNIVKAFGLDDKQIEEIFEGKDSDKIGYCFSNRSKADHIHIKNQRSIRWINILIKEVRILLRI